MIESHKHGSDEIMAKVQSLKNEERLKEESWIKHNAIRCAGSYFQVCFYKVFEIAAQLKVEEAGRIILNCGDNEIEDLINTLKDAIITKNLSGRNLEKKEEEKLQKWNKKYLSALADIELLFGENAQKAMIELIKMGGMNDFSIPHLLREEGIVTNAQITSLELIYKKDRGPYLGEGGFPPSCLVDIYLEKHKTR